MCVVCAHGAFAVEMAIENMSFAFFRLIFSHTYLRRSCFWYDVCDVASTLRIEWDRMRCDIIMAIIERCVCATETNSWYSIKINRKNENQPNKDDDDDDNTSNQEEILFNWINKNWKFQVQCSGDDFYSIESIFAHYFFGTNFNKILKCDTHTLTQRLWKFCMQKNHAFNVVF